MTNVSTFGCSWTSGVWPDFYNWPEWMAHDNPYLNVNDFGWGGTSIKWSAGQLLHRKQAAPADLTVFQITGKARLTIANQEANFSALRKELSPNFIKWDPTVAQHIQTIHRYFRGATTKFMPVDDVEAVYKAWDKSFDVDIETHEHNMYINWVRPQVDFMFFHKKRDQRLYYESSAAHEIPCVEEHFGTKQFNEWIYDDGHHFGPEGSREVAKWVKQKLV